MGRDRGWKVWDGGDGPKGGVPPAGRGFPWGNIFPRAARGEKSLGECPQVDTELWDAHEGTTIPRGDAHGGGPPKMLHGGAGDSPRAGPAPAGGSWMRNQGEKGKEKEKGGTGGGSGAEAPHLRAGSRQGRFRGEEMADC